MKSNYKMKDFWTLNPYVSAAWDDTICLAWCLVFQCTMRASCIVEFNVGVYILRNKRGDAWFEKRREEYRVLIRDVFNEYRQVLGAEKIRTILVQRGYKVITRFVADDMREMGLLVFCARFIFQTGPKYILQ